MIRILYSNGFSFCGKCKVCGIRGPSNVRVRHGNNGEKTLIRWYHGLRPSSLLFCSLKAATPVVLASPSSQIIVIRDAPDDDDLAWWAGSPGRSELIVCHPMTDKFLNGIGCWAIDRQEGVGKEIRSIFAQAGKLPLPDKIFYQSLKI